MFVCLFVCVFVPKPLVNNNLEEYKAQSYYRSMELRLFLKISTANVNDLIARF